MSKKVQSEMTVETTDLYAVDAIHVNIAMDIQKDCLTNTEDKESVLAGLMQDIEQALRNVVGL